MNKIHLWPEEITYQGDYVTKGFQLEESNGDRKSLWYRLPSEFSPIITEWCDPLVIGALFHAMSVPADLLVHGYVSPSLIFNLREFQDAWSSWFPDQYTRIDIIPEVSKERSKSITQDAVMTFSMGVDASFTAWRYKKPNIDRIPYNLQAGVLVHGFDFPPQYDETFDRAIRRAKVMMNSLGMTLIPMTTNLRTSNQPISSRHGAFLASCLMLLQDGFQAGLVGSSYPYVTMQLTWGSNPLTDRMLSSSRFSIIHDGAGFNRLEKLAFISDWPEAIQNLRVCIRREADKRDQNCCRCEKCIRTILELRALGFRSTSSFEKEVKNRQILRMNISEDVLKSKFYNEILEVAKSRNITDSWLGSLRLSIFLNKIKIQVKELPGIRRFNTYLKRKTS